MIYFISCYFSNKYRYLLDRVALMCDTLTLLIFRGSTGINRDVNICLACINSPKEPLWREMKLQHILIQQCRTDIRYANNKK